MTDFALYDVVNICRECGSEYPAKAFLPQGTEPRFGLCPAHMALDDERQAKLTQPPKPYGRPKNAEPDPRSATDRRRYPTHQRRWEPQD